MNLLRLIPAAILVASAGLALAASAPAPSSSSSRRSSTPPAPAPGDYENFRIIAERNIFNPNRIGRVREGGDGPAAPREDVLTLVGTLESDKGIVAIFDSPDSALRKAVRDGQSLGGFKIKSVDTNSVQLEGEKQSFSLNVNQRLRRIEQGEWKVSNVEPPPVAAPSGPDPSSAPLAIPANASEVLRRLMEQRQKQLKQ